MREFATKVPVGGDDKLVDTRGTGGDAAHSFNISTAAAFVALPLFCPRTAAKRVPSRAQCARTL